MNMKKHLSLAVIFAFFGSAGTSFGGSLEDSALPNLPTMKEIRAEFPPQPETTRVQMSIWNYAYTNSFSINDPYLRVQLSGRKAGNDRIDFSGQVGNEYLSGYVRRSYDGELFFSADFTNLVVRKWGGDYSVSGTTGFNNEPMQYVDFRIYNSGFGGFTISHAGMYLNASLQIISGDFDASRYSKKVVASLAVIIVSIQLKLDEPAEPAKK